MKTILLSSKPLLRYRLLVCLLVVSMMSAAQNSSELVFAGPILYSGTAGQDNAVYKFSNVNSSLDALVRISGRSSSQVKLDNIDLTTTGFNKAFQPQVSYSNGNVNSASSWWMEFEITFVNKGTVTPATVSSFQVTALDIDGDGSNLREWDAFYGLSTYTLEANSLLSVTNLTQVVSGVTQVIGKTFTGPVNQYSGIDTTQTKIMATSTYNNTSVFKLRFGATTTGAASTARMYSAWFKDFTYAAPIIASLPVTLTFFTATLNNNKAELKWETASELNFSHFVVERSLDGKNFSDAGLVFAYGGLSEKTDYSFNDDVSSYTNSIVYYRLRSVDNDGKSQYSEIRLIRTNRKADALNLAIYPNPASGQIRLTMPSGWQGKAVLVELFNQGGQRMVAQNIGSSSQTETLDINILPKGLYLVKASCGPHAIAQKVIKQ